MSDLRIIPADGIEPRRVRFLDSAKMIPLRSLTILFGPAGLGKTTYSVSLAAAVTQGRMAGFSEPRNVLISSQEDDLDDTLVPRAIAAGADLSRLSFLRNLDLPSGVETLRERVKELRPGLLIIDPISSHLDTGVDSHKNAATRRALTPVAELAADLDFAVIAVSHPNKATGGPGGLERLSGSGAFGEAPRSVIVFGVDPSAEDRTDERVIAHLKSNKGPESSSFAGKIEAVKIETKDGLAEHTRLVVTGSSEVSAKMLLQTRQPEPDGGPDPRSFLDEALADGPVPTLELRSEAEEAGVSWRKLERVKKDAGVQAERRGGSWYWVPPEREAA